MRERYVEQVSLLVKLLPAVAAEEDFALKGGTAINLFHHDMPRLSVDIDLMFLPVRDRATSLNAIDAAMDRIAARGAGAGISASRVAGGGGGETRVLFTRGATRVKVETTPVTRGVVFESEERRVHPAVEEAFGFAEMKVVSFEDLYAGKLIAALDRQHPRDLFDVRVLYEHQGLTDDLFRAFLIYLVSSGRPPHELLNPHLKPLADVFAKEFAGMPRVQVTVGELEATRDQLIGDLRRRLTGPAADFLRTLVGGRPDFEAIGLPAAAELPAVRWKLRNLAKLREVNPQKYEAQAAALEALLL